MANINPDQIDPARLLQCCAFVPDLLVASRDEALTALVAVLSSCYPVIPEKEVLHSVLQRERLRATGTPEGVAFPHGKHTSVAGGVYAVVASLQEPVDFGGDTILPCQIIVLTVSSAFRSDGHLCFLGFMARHLRLDNVRKRILAARDKAEFLAILSLA